MNCPLCGNEAYAEETGCPFCGFSLDMDKKHASAVAGNSATVQTLSGGSDGEDRAFFEQFGLAPDQEIPDADSLSLDEINEMMRKMGLDPIAGSEGREASVRPERPVEPDRIEPFEQMPAGFDADEPDTDDRMPETVFPSEPVMSDSLPLEERQAENPTAAPEAALPAGKRISSDNGTDAKGSGVERFEADAPESGSGRFEGEPASGSERFEADAPESGIERFEEAPEPGIERFEAATAEYASQTEPSSLETLIHDADAADRTDDNSAAEAFASVEQTPAATLSDAARFERMDSFAGGSIFDDDDDLAQAMSFGRKSLQEEELAGVDSPAGGSESRGIGESREQGEPGTQGEEARKETTEAESSGEQPANKARKPGQKRHVRKSNERASNRKVRPERSRMSPETVAVVKSVLFHAGIPLLMLLAAGLSFALIMKAAYHQPETGAAEATAETEYEPWTPETDEASDLIIVLPPGDDTVAERKPAQAEESVAEGEAAHDGDASQDIAPEGEASAAEGAGANEGDSEAESAEPAGH